MHVEINALTRIRLVDNFTASDDSEAQNKVHFFPNVILQFVMARDAIGAVLLMSALSR